jgi:uncharacterized membrane protein
MEGGLIHEILVIIHIIGAILGIGGTSVVDFLHLRGLKNRKFERRVITIYPAISSLILMGVFILVASGTLLVLTHPEEYLTSPLFRLKMFLVLIIIVNGYFLSKKIFPKIMDRVHEKENYPEKRRLVILTSLLGSISIVTWYFVFVLAMTKYHDYSYTKALLVYVSFVILVFLISLFTERSSNSFGHKR